MSNCNNPNCDGGQCHKSTGEVRKLPMGGSANAILCFDCYRYEMQYRRERNEELEDDCKFAIPLWDSLEVDAGEVV